MRRGLRGGRAQGPSGGREEKGRPGPRRRLKGAPGRGTLAKEKPPVFGMIQRTGEVVIRMRANVKQRTMGPLIKGTIAPGTVVYTDEYDIYARLPEWGYTHRTVGPAAGEFARDDDGDGFCEVHVNTMEGFWSLLRSWLRPHRGISQEKLPLSLGFFEFVHNVRKRGKALLGALIELLVSKDPGIQAERAEFERNLIEERSLAGLSAARARGRIGGKPPLDASAGKVVMAKKLYMDKTNSISEICRMLNISRATLYRYISAGRGNLQPH